MKPIFNVLALSNSNEFDFTTYYAFKDPYTVDHFFSKGYKEDSTFVGTSFPIVEIVGTPKTVLVGIS